MTTRKSESDSASIGVGAFSFERERQMILFHVTQPFIIFPKGGFEIFGGGLALPPYET